jgi:hypothetical protein
LGTDLRNRFAVILVSHRLIRAVSRPCRRPAATPSVVLCTLKARAESSEIAAFTYSSVGQRPRGRGRGVDSRGGGDSAGSVRVASGRYVDELRKRPTHEAKRTACGLDSGPAGTRSDLGKCRGRRERQMPTSRLILRLHHETTDPL